MDEDTAQLWWAGKELARGKKLLDYIGKNEKTKIVAKLQKACHVIICCKWCVSELDSYMPHCGSPLGVVEGTGCAQQGTCLW